MSVNIIRHKRRKKSAFYITSEGIELRIPARLSNRVVETILQEHADWIQDQLADLPKKPSLPNDRLRYQGEIVPLVRTDAVDAFDYDGTVFRCPDRWEASKLESAYETWLRDKALTYVIERAPYYERLLGVNAMKIRIGHQKTRWGSCSSSGTISINVRLMLAPIEVMDYVIAHEWTHLVHFDHSKSFWSTLASVYPDVDGAMGWLRQHGHTLVVKKNN